MCGPLRICGGNYVSFCALSHLVSFLGGTHCFLCILEIMCAFSGMYLSIHAFFPPQIHVVPSTGSIALGYLFFVMYRFSLLSKSSILFHCMDVL